MSISTHQNEEWEGDHHWLGNAVLCRKRDTTSEGVSEYFRRWRKSHLSEFLLGKECM